MKITFCITYYNQQEFVAKSIESILAIDKPCDFEILIGDDGSTDNTIEKVKEFQNLYPDKIKLFVMPRNNNINYNPIYRVAQNRLNLAEHSSGDFIMFLDGDDYYCDKTFIKEAMEQFKKNDKLIACAFNYQKYYENNNKIEKTTQKFSTGLLDKKRYIRKAYYTHSGAFVFKNIFDSKKLLNLKNNKNFDDNLITIYMFQFGDVYYIDKPIYSYRQITNSIWNSTPEIEQFLLNAMDYEIISRVAPKYKRQIAKRQSYAIKNIYKLRKDLHKIIDNVKYNKYVEENIFFNNKFILNILTWNEISFLKKIFTTIEYLKIKY